MMGSTERDAFESIVILMALALSEPPNGLRISRRRRRAAQDSFKKATISRAEGGRAASVRHGGP